ncbi:bifunctional methylenetetrahydrofolate dehydrogenase/methenyltetrahydrofolate cyclohydrolase FolD [Fictibacillus gelatini]|uniref:bifunctional methylenetetrahydrofolate dehydrogenase/methenyltetrahydrofolate cyclohydrolase FolD n=1 Tax=Fictibacillus gelatini TaxID=225985 RepID=UPI0003F8C7A9|nr:bifunctional methylenetetrahydrofolate dehydrogenase/methenyltetrahydrofolate cyclohydrolase FolD [Fictibacillus gelatini]
MAAVLLNGKELAEKKQAEMKSEVEHLADKGIVPGLAVIIVGANPASQTYVRSKVKACEKVGMHSVLVELPETVTEEELLDQVEKFNKDRSIHGILVQLPLPDHISEQKVIETIIPEKDVDGFHPVNVGKMMLGQECFISCTPYGILELIKAYELPMEGKHVVVVGRSNIVGKPVGQLMLNENATVTYCHSKTENLKEITSQGDILIVAVGRPKMIGKDMVKEGAVVIDVGINRMEDGKLCGDVDFEDCLEKASYITPVPKGVGPMTITMLLANTIQSAKRAYSI